MPESIVKIQGSELNSLAISIWSTGRHGIACKSNFSSMPTDHNNCILVNDCNENIITCFGDITIQSMEFVDKPPILVFDINKDLSSEITSFNQIPKEVHIYDQCFDLAGVTFSSKIDATTLRIYFTTIMDYFTYMMHLNAVIWKNRLPMQCKDKYHYYFTFTQEKKTV